MTPRHEPPLFVPVHSLDDPRLGGYANVRERDLAGRDGLFVVEGKSSLRVLLTGGRFRVRSVLLAEGRVADLAGALTALPPDTPVYVAPQAVMDAVVGFPIHRGVLALAERGEPLPPATLLRASPGDHRPVVLGLLGLSNHDNVGGIFRNAAAFGAAAVLLDPLSCDPLYRKSVRVSVGGALVVPFARCDSESGMLATLEAAGYEALALTPRGEVEVAEIAAEPPRKAALLLGAEGPGLSDAVLARARRVRIGIVPTFDSLNVSVAAGVALHALFTARRAIP